MKFVATLVVSGVESDLVHAQSCIRHKPFDDFLLIEESGKGSWRWGLVVFVSTKKFTGLKCSHWRQIKKPKLNGFLWRKKGDAPFRTFFLCFATRPWIAFFGAVNMVYILRLWLKSVKLLSYTHQLWFNHSHLILFWFPFKKMIENSTMQENGEF